MSPDPAPLKSLSQRGNAPAGRGDLVRLMTRFGEEGLDMAADLVGYARIEKKEDLPLKRKPPSREGIKPSETDAQDVTHYFEPEEKARFWRVSGHKTKEKEKKERPAWIDDTIAFAPGEVRRNLDIAPPKQPPLVPWFQMWPFLKSALGMTHETRQIDMAKAPEEAARLAPVDAFPREQKKAWAPVCRLLLDFDTRLTPFWSDMSGLQKGIEKLRGRLGLETYILENGPEESWRKWGDDRRKTRPGAPEPGSPVLIASDLGAFDSTGRFLKSWLRFGKRLRRAGFVPVVLNPCPPGRWEKEWTGVFQVVRWDRGRRLPRMDASRRIKTPLSLEKPPDEKAEKARAKRLLGLLSPAVWVENALLRAIRLLLPRKSVDAGTEAAVWNHEDTHACSLGFALKNEVIDDYFERFLEKKPEKFRDKVLDVIQNRHSYFSDALKGEEAFIAGALAGRDTGRAEMFMRRFVATILQGALSEHGGETAWFDRLTARRFDHPNMWEKSEALAAAWGIINRERCLKGSCKLPRQMDASRIAWVFEDSGPPLHLKVSQRGEQFVVCDKSAALEVGPEGWSAVGSPVAELTSGDFTLQAEWMDEDGGESDLFYLSPGKPLQIPISDSNRLVLHTDHDDLTVTSLERPSWAEAVGRDKNGLFLIPQGEELDQRFYWPRWSDRLGNDDYGMYADFVIAGVQQRFRWIKPGRFMMGSPEDEPGRFDDELLHEVVITEGFWLADTACSQKLWEAVMGNNPSEFKGEKRPVDSVSWYDCMEFIQKINSKIPCLNLRLPTETEWEYACRAGTQTPFSFGDTITTYQAHYDENYPYTWRKKWKSQKKTMNVKSFPSTVNLKSFHCNAWGLYEMHGNVWEWCFDGKRKYEPGVALSPTGQVGGKDRVLRGGGWINESRYLRSASRGVNEPDVHWDNQGFRLAQGHPA
ncbi:putative Formylglycine-generating enzyme, required for sulfatase activity, contains SUMF1/FGE domain [Candidatus Desulfarcum epimagneticum]|uniref:Putative Formylglycine-generating enzyme, required for sulfatase activity, contains SUMF1/FGE domain n=1 Tax=uncultured Desulfobacteraceae bacterium TaxID=218296 RepID=A0A484HG54_9BACT|nr:putative Formylglycine-generating enzyme, required for sulfatase activity, contains SUMF1/FGE domain [uncultured Desulfobacteraceae bacterium]